MRIVLALGCLAALGGFLGAVFLLPERADEPAPGTTSSPRRTQVLAAQAVREVVAIRSAGAEAASSRLRSSASSAKRRVSPAGQAAERCDSSCLHCLLPQRSFGRVRIGRSLRRPRGANPRDVSARSCCAQIRSEEQSRARLRRELGAGGDPWPPVLAFTSRSEELRRRLAREIDAMMVTIPAHESDAVRRAFAGG